MENKEISTVKKITTELIAGFFLYGIIFSILYRILYGTMISKTSSISLVLTAIISIIMQGIIVFLVWRCSIATVFKKRAIDGNDVATVMRNLYIFTVIVCVIAMIMNFTEVNKSIDNVIESQSAFEETFMEYAYSDDEILEYQREKEQNISDAKSKLYTYLVLMEIGSLAVYIGVLPLQKKAILKYAV